MKGHLFTVWELKQEGGVENCFSAQPCPTSSGKLGVRRLRVFCALHQLTGTARVVGVLVSGFQKL